MWWASFGLSCQLYLYPFKPKKPECWIDVSTTYDVELDEGQHHYDEDYLPGATEVLLRRHEKKRTPNDKRKP